MNAGNQTVRLAGKSNVRITRSGGWDHRRNSGELRAAERRQWRRTARAQVASMRMVTV